MPLIALTESNLILSGQFLGRGDPAGARKITFQTWTLAFCYTLSAFFVILFFSRPVIAWFAPERSGADVSFEQLAGLADGINPCVFSFRPASYPGGISLQQGKNENSAKEFVYLSPRPAARHISLPSSLASDSFRPRGKHVPRKKGHPEREGHPEKDKEESRKRKIPDKRKTPVPSASGNGSLKNFFGIRKSGSPAFPPPGHAE